MSDTNELTVTCFIEVPPGFEPGLVSCADELEPFCDATGGEVRS